MAYLATDKTLRSTEIKFEVAESELRLFAEKQYHTCQALRSKRVGGGGGGLLPSLPQSCQSICSFF